MLGNDHHAQTGRIGYLVLMMGLLAFAMMGV